MDDSKLYCCPHCYNFENNPQKYDVIKSHCIAKHNIDITKDDQIVCYINSDTESENDEDEDEDETEYYTPNELYHILKNDEKFTVDKLNNFVFPINVLGIGKELYLDFHYDDNIDTDAIKLNSIKSPEIRDHFQNIADKRDINEVSKEVFKYYTEDLHIEEHKKFIMDIKGEFNYLTTKYKQLYLNTLITQYTKYCSFVAECLADPANFGHVFEILKLCIELQDREYIDAICDKLWISENKNYKKYEGLSINWSLLQYEAKLSGNMEILRRMKREEFIRNY